MANEDPKPKRMGRPRKYASDAKRPTLTFRVRDSLYEKLKSSAEAGERSISEEIERRLDLSFRDYDYFTMLAGSETDAKFLWSCMTTLRFVQERYGVDWAKDEKLNRIVAHTMAYIAARMGPSGLTGLKDTQREEMERAVPLSTVGRHFNKDGVDPVEEVKNIESLEKEGRTLLI